MSASLMKKESRKKLPFQSSEQEAVLNILRTGDQFQNRLGRLFRAHGLTPSQYNVLRILRGEGQPMPSLEVGSRMIQVVPAMTGLIDRLEKLALVRRKRCTEDRRVVYVDLTKKARELLKQLDKPVQQLEKKLIGHLGRKELAVLVRLLEKARRGPGSGET